MRALQLRPRPGCLAVAGLTGNFGWADQPGLVCQWEGWPAKKMSVWVPTLLKSLQVSGVAP